MGFFVRCSALCSPLRANVGVKYDSDNFNAVINLRIFSPAFGNTIDGKSYDKISADTYFANYKWDTEYGKFNLQFGRFRTDWSVGGNFGTYVDVLLDKRGFLSRDYQHDAVSFGYEKGVSSFSALLGTYDAKFNTGYIRFEETLKFEDAKVSLAYRVNALDPIQHTAQVTHRVAGRASYYFQKNFGLYGEVALIATGDGENLKAANAIKPEYAQDSKYVPFFVGLEIPTGGFLNNLYAELEYSRLVQLSSKIRRLQRFHRADTGGEVFAGIVTGIVTGSFALLRMTLVHFFVDAERVDNFQVVFEFAGDGLWRDMVLGVEFLLQCAATVRLVDGLLQTFGHIVRFSG